MVEGILIEGSAITSGNRMMERHTGPSEFGSDALFVLTVSAAAIDQWIETMQWLPVLPQFAA
ncbi:hypothetical protein ABIB25_004197 [Nakamurella sp. UYEF19]|uniref:hypothetical protein n=1 Tax=Nakamurella sp. UYEF19 TaxID=1756392 RepID=UPI0033952EB3